MKHYIQPGETLTLIAAKYGMTVAQVLALNPQVTNPDLIFAGDWLTIRAENNPQPTQPVDNPQPATAGGSEMMMLAAAAGVGLLLLLGTGKKRRK